MPIKTQCKVARCPINGSLNTGECECSLNTSYLTDLQLLGMMDNYSIHCDTVAEAQELIARLHYLRYNDGNFRIMCNYLNRVKDEVNK